MAFSNEEKNRLKNDYVSNGICGKRESMKIDGNVYSTTTQYL